MANENFNLTKIDPDNYLYDLNSSSHGIYVSTCDLRTINSPTSSSNNLVFLHVNCRSIFNKVHEILIPIEMSHAKVIAVTETWVDQTNNDDISIPGFSFICVPRNGKRGDGVEFFIHQNLNFSIISPNQITLSFEYLFVKL